MKRRAANQSSDDEKNFVTWRELVSELKAFRFETRLILVVGFVGTRVHLPSSITVGSIVGAVGIAGLKSFFAR